MWKNWQKYGMFLALMLIATLAQAATAQLQNIKVTIAAQKTRLVFTLSQPVHYHVATLYHPAQIIIAFPHTHLATQINPKLFTHSLVSKIQVSNTKPDTLRLTLYLHTAQYHQILEIRPHKKGGEEIVIELSSQVPISKKKLENSKELMQNWVQETLPQSSPQPANADNVNPLSDDMIMDDNDDVLVNTDAPNTAQSASTQTAPPAVASTAIVTSSSPAILPATQTQRPIVVVIDPGHGGKDPGTTGQLGVHEKDVVLSISRYLYQYLAKDPAFRPALTRSADYFIPLRGRLAIARKDKGDMFVAIHADAYRDPYATGVAIFALSAHGASSEAARWLAEKENYSELGDVSLSGLTDKSDVLRSVLIDLSQTATISASMQLGVSMLQQMGKISNLHYHHIEQAPFMVLKSPDIPSLLVETGFLSSPMEERRLHNAAYQQKLAQAMYLGIKNYFWMNPPPGTLMASLKQNKKYDA